jgi:Ca2+-binding RTX toxin-like protein
MASKWGFSRIFGRNSLQRKPVLPPQRRPHFEALEPRVLLSADLLPATASFLSDGLDQFGTRLEGFLDSGGVAEDGSLLLDTHLPFILQVQTVGDEAEQVAPTIGDLFSVQVDRNGLEPGGNDPTLEALDTQHGNDDGIVDAGEFIQGWFFDPVESLLDSVSVSSSDYLASYLELQLEGASYDHTLDLGYGTVITFTMGDITDLSTGLDDLATGTIEHTPAGNVAWDIDFQLKVSQNLAVDLGLEAAAFKIVPFDQAEYDATGKMETPTLPVDATIDFGFTFGLNTGGQEVIGQELNAEDFFIRSADDLVVSVTSDDTDFDSLLNIGFLGAQIVDGTIHLRADVVTQLVDPDSPDVLGFTEDQYDFRNDTGIDTGIITATDPVPLADLAHDAQFTLRIGNLGIATEVTVVDNNRTQLDDGDRTNANDLLDDVNAALTSAGLNDLITASFNSSDHLVFTLIETTVKPLGFANESFSDTGELSVDPGAFELTSNQTFLLSVDGALPTLVDVRFPDPAKSDIGFNDSQNAAPYFVGENDAIESGILTEAADFTVEIIKSNGLSVGVVVVSVARDTTNSSREDLVEDINEVLSGTTLNGLIAADVVGSKITLQKIDGADVSIIEIIYADSVTENEIGFVQGQTSTLTMVAANPVSNVSLDDGKAATKDDAHIKITVTTVSDTSTKVAVTTIVVTPGSENGTDLAAAIETALQGAGFAIDASFTDNHIILKAQDTSVLAFSIKTINETIDDLVDDVNLALDEAGLDTVTASKSEDGTKLILTEVSGKTLEITETLSLDAGVTYAELQTPDPDAPGADPTTGTATADLFAAAPNDLSNITFSLPVQVLPGLEDASTIADDNYDPINLAIVGNFNPFSSYAQDSFDLSGRFNLTLNVDPDEQTDGSTVVAPIAVPNPGDLDSDGEIQLVNFAEPLNFNLVTAESMIGLLRSLGSSLQQIAGSSQFSLYDIPFAEASLSDLVVFDQLIQTSLIYDVGNDGVFNDDPLVSNAASGDESLLLERTITGEGDNQTVEQLPSFKTAQELADKLKEILAVADMEGIGGINPTYDPRTNELTYDVELLSDARVSVGVPDLSDPNADPPAVDPVPDPFEVPFEFDVDLSPFGKLTVDKTVAEGLANVRLQAHSGLSMTFGVDLSQPGAVIYDSTTIGGLNGGSGVDIKLENAVTGEAGVRSVLSDDAHIFLDLDVLAPVWLTIDKEATYTNKTTQDFANDINAVLDNTFTLDGWNVGYFVDAWVKDGRLALTAVNEAESLVVYANGTKDVSGQYIDTAWTQLGFSTSSVSGKTVSALKAPTPAVGRLSSDADATFWVDLDNDGLDLYEVTVKASATTANMTMSDLVADVDNALAATDIGNDLGFTAYQTTSLEPLVLTGANPALLNLTAPAEFKVKINDGSPVPVSVKEAFYFTIAELTIAVNYALEDAGLDSLLAAEFEGNRIVLHALDTSITELAIEAGSDNALGFDTLQSAALDKLVLTAPYGTHLELADDMHIAVGLDDGTTVSITVASGTYANIGALVAAVNTSLATAGIDEQVKAVALDDPHTAGTDYRIISLQAQDLSVVRIAVEEGSRFLSSLLKADYDMSPTLGSRLVIGAVDPATEFSLSVGVGSAQLGLLNDATADRTDFVIFDRTGKEHNIVLDGLNQTVDDVDDLMNLIAAQTEGAVTLEFNATHTGLRLVDNTTGTLQFHVMTVNSSSALLQLGFLNTFNPNNPDYIEGGSIGLTHLDGRFFIRDAEIRAEGIRMDTPPEQDIDGTTYEGVDGTALFGVVGLDINVQGTVFAEMSAQLQAAGGAPGSQVTLADLRAGTKYGELQYNTPSGGLFTVGSILGGSESHAQALIIADDTVAHTLTLKILEGRFLDGEYISDGYGVRAQTNGGFSTIVTDPVVSKAREISYTDQTANFTSGSLLTGVDSGATAIILTGDDNGTIGTLTLYHIKGTFLDGEIITGGGGSATANIAVASEDSFVQLSYNAQPTDNNFTVGSTLTGSGGATAEILADADVGGEGTLTLKILTGAFAPGETITDAAGGSATANTLYEKDVTRLVYTDKTSDSDFTANTFITSGVANRALVISDIDNTLTLVVISGTFADGATITSEGGVSAVVDGSLPTKANFGEFNLAIDVQDGFGDLLDFGPGFAVLDGQHYDVDFALSEFGNPFDPALPVADFYNLNEDIGALAEFEHLDYADISTALDGLLTLLEDVEAKFDLFNNPLPAINKSISDLLSLVNGFTRGVNNANEIFAAATDALDPDNIDLPALTLQDISKALRGAFGLDPDGLDEEGNPTLDRVQLDYDQANKMLLVDLALHEDVSTKLGLDIVLLDADGNPILDNNGDPLANLTSGGVLKVSGALDINLHCGIELAEPNNAYLFDTSSIAADLHVEGEGQVYESSSGDQAGMGLVFRASIGPLAVFIQDGDALIDVAFSLPGLDFGEGIHQKLISAVTYDDFKDPIISENTIDIVLPMFFGGEGPNDYLSDFKATGTLEGIEVTTPDFSKVVDAIDNGTIEVDPFDNIMLAFDTLNFYLEGLSDIVADEVLGINLPFVGDQLADILFIESFRNTLYSTLKNGVANAINPDPDTFIQDLLIDDVNGLFTTGLLKDYYVAGSLQYDDNVGVDNNLDGEINTEDIWDQFRQWNFSLEKEKTYIIDNFDLGIFNLGFDVDVPVSVTLKWQMDLGFGVNFVEGAYVDVSGYDMDDVDITLDLTIALPPGVDTDGDGEIDGWSGTLGFLPLTVTDPGNDTGALVNFQVDVQNKNTSAVPGHLGFSDLGSITQDSTIEGRPLDVNGATDAVTLHLVTEALLGLPSLSTDLVINWSLAAGTTVSSLAGEAVAPGTNLIALNNMTMDAGSVAESLLGPLFGDVLEFIEPFMPVIDTLTYPIPILSDVAGEPFTLLDLAAIFGSVDPAFIEAVADILDVISSINDFMTAPDLPLGNLVLYQYDQLGDTDPGTGTVLIGNFIPNDQTAPFSDLADIGVVLGMAGWTFDQAAYDAVINSDDFLKDVRDGNLADGLTMPILTDPRQAVMLLLNQNAVMIDYLLPPLMVDFSYLQVFPIFGPLSLSIEISFGFTLDLHSVGFDTNGYQRYADGGFRNVKVIFDGFYLGDLDEEGADTPEVLFEFGLVGAAELNLGIARAGVEGGIEAEIFFDWYDAYADGRVHISEMANSIWANDGNPIAVFDVGGALTFQMAAFLEISIIGFELEIPITPEITLFDFEIPFERPPILATQADGLLILNTGPNAEDRLVGNTSDGSEEITVNWISGNTVEVTSTMFGVGSGKQVFDGITHIVGTGGQGDDIITLNLGDSKGISYELEGGLGDDNLIVNGGTGSGTIHGGVGNDTLTGGGGDDIIYGEEGIDTINGAAGYDILFGDFGRVFENLTDPDPLVTSRVTDADGNDTILGGDDDDIIIGGGGDDILNGEAGSDVIIGDGGRFAFLDDADGHFNISTVRPASYTGYTRPGIDTYIDPATISDDIDAIYYDLMAIFSSTDLGVGGNDTISGGGADDIVLGGSGDDTVNGDGGADIILAGKGFDDIHGGADDDTVFGGDQADTIAGDAGDDVISGGSGNDFIHGNANNDVMKGDSGADIMFGDAGNDLVFGQTEPDTLFGGADNDLVVGGTSNDIMFGDDGLVVKIDPDTTDGSDDSKVIGIGFGGVAPVGQYMDTDIRTVDLIITDVVTTDGNDILSGDAADDIMLGGGGNDLMGGDVDPRLASAGTDTSISEDVMIGDGGKIVFDLRRFQSISTVVDPVSPVDPAADNKFNDIIYGDNGNDYLFGGWGNDFLFGGHGKAVDLTADPGEEVGAARGVTDAGASDNDIILGDNGEILFAGYSSEHPDNFGIKELIRTTDSADDTGGHEYVEGQLGNDVIFGGVNGSDDVLFGNAGDDVILGDNGELDFDFNDADHNLDTLDLIRSYRDGLGGTDIISGLQGDDVLIGGTGGDMMYGDDATASSGAADGEDIMLGDNADIFLIGTVGRLTVQVAEMTTGTAVDRITTTDSIAPGDPNFDEAAEVEAAGGPDTMSGNAGNDIMLGGVNNNDGIFLNGIEKDTMYGDRAETTPTTIANDGNDILLGDNGELRFTLPGGEDYDDLVDSDRWTLDLIRSYRDGLGGSDLITGNKGQDVAIGGTGGDTIYGDDATASAEDADLGDMLLGDNADIFTKGAYNGPALLNALGTGVALITTTDAAESTGGIDTITGNAGADVIMGGVAGDTLYGDAATPVNALDGDDVILGDNGQLDFAADRNLSLELTGSFDLTTLDLIESFTDGLGGVDTISGNAGADTVLGGTAGDTIYGDNALAGGTNTDKNDLLFGDNGYAWLVSPALDSTNDGADRILILGGAVALVRSTDEPDKGPDEYVASDTGGIDTISGNAGGDIILGGVLGDTLYGDRMVVTTATNLIDGRDIVLGDNGALEWLSMGRLIEISGIVVAEQNADLANGFTDRDANLDTLDLITTEQPTNGGRDTIYGDNARDVIFGGTDADTLYGDTGSEADEWQSDNGNDLMFGDHGRLYPQFSRYMVNGTLTPSNDIYARNFFAIDVGDTDGGDGDRMWGEEGADIMLGQQGDDRMWGGSGDDDMTGGHNVAGGYDELTVPAIIATLGQGVNDLMDGGTGDDSMAGDNAIIWRRGDDLSPRFQALTVASIYTTNAETIVANIDADAWQSDPADAVGRDIQLVDHSDAVQANPLGRYGNDVMAGGADSDTMFGELGNDLMQGDGAIETDPASNPDFISRMITVTDDGINPYTGQTLYFNIPELASDGDDYLEGNGGSDLMYGGLGQDDMIGGSSALFGLNDVNAELLGYVGEQLRPDTFDYLYGGAGIATARNDIGATTFGLASEDDTTHVITTTADGHARDADYIMGDNANVYRLVVGGVYPVSTSNPADTFLTFNYDTYGTLKIIPRAMQQLDYTLGGGDYAGGGYNADGQATPIDKPVDNGAADLIHGESGDDIIFGMTGSDVLFGEGQDDDIVGGYGQDWISGGTGQDGILGDDGLIRTSRNSTAGEPLNAIAGLLASDPEPKYANGNVLNEVIRTPGDIQYAVINLTNELKKTIDLVPFSYDQLWTAMDDEFPDNMDDSPFADDIIFGGLGSDWLHGGSGDDAISGAEALAQAYVPVYDADGNPTSILDLGYAAVDLPASSIIPGETQVMAIPGDVLAYNKDDTDGQHLNNRFRAGEFDLYDEYDPRRTILLTPDGELYKGTSGIEGEDYYQFLLNFNEAEGVVRAAGTVPKATGQQTESYPQVNDDGKDAIFGDLGNDWLVGGTGRDNLYGGWGNDLLNADDDHDGHLDTSELNDFTDTHPYYEDRAYGGAGRDVLIGNTGGDRLIDWVGEYNSYLVPYAPFGQASVSRTMMPFLHEFLYSLSAGDGADPTRSGDTGGDLLRNGEPDAEMGLVLQKDFAWQDQTGAPADPQAGNIPGGPRDVLRSATFNDATTQGFAIDSGNWALQSGVLYVEPTKIGTNALAVWNHDQVVPSYFELTATITPVKPIAGYKANAYIVFDYYSADDFKFAGINTSTNKIEVGRYTTAGGWQVLASTNMIIKAGTSYNLLVALNGTSATIVVNNKLSASYTFAPRVDVYGMTHNFNDGMIGLGANSAKASIDNVSLRVLPPTITLTRTDDFSVTPALLAGETGTWKLSKGYYVGTPAAGEMLALAQGSLTVGANYQLQIDTRIATTATGGIVFDQYAADDFKWAAYSKATNQILLGHYTADGGWVVDTAVSRTLTGDVTLSVILKGSTVKVLVNGSVAITHSYNAVVTDGGFGLMARGGTASFDSFTVKTDDPAFAVTASSLLAALAAPAADEPAVTISAVPSELIEAANMYWRNVLGEAAGSLGNITFEVADLGGLLLGQAQNNAIRIDNDAAGYGWFIDTTPEDSVEFQRQGAGYDTWLATGSSPAVGQMDLLTTLTHEIGHLLGYDHTTSGAVMDQDLEAGTRALPQPTADAVAPGRTISMAAKESLVFDEVHGVFRDLLQGKLVDSTLGGAAAREQSIFTDRKRKEDAFWLVEV